jgi:DNA-directed RNA polymerase alpha subunit
MFFYALTKTISLEVVEVNQMNNKQQVVAVRKNGDGDIVELQLSSGQVVDYKEAQQMAKNEMIDNVNVFKGRDGDEHLRSNADGRKDNNLDQLPTF